MPNKEWKLYKIAADDARATKEGKDVGVQISEGVFVTVANHFTSAAPVDGGKVDSLEEIEGRIADAWVKCHDGIHVFVLYFWRSEGRTVLKRVANTKSHRIIACDANMETREFQFGDWYKRPKRKWKR